MIEALKGTALALLVVVLLFMAILIGELALAYLLDIIDNRMARRSKRRRGVDKDTKKM